MRSSALAELFSICDLNVTGGLVLTLVEGGRCAVGAATRAGDKHTVKNREDLPRRQTQFIRPRSALHVCA